MAPKHSTPTNNPPASSSDEEETASSGEEESSSEDEQNEKTKVRASSPPQLTQTAKAVKKSDTSIKKAKSEPESESETESDSESEDVPTSNVKPIASKPMETPSKSSKSRSKGSASTAVLGKCSAKRGSEVERDAKDSKRSKAKNPESNGTSEKSEDTKKLLFQRLWSEGDEVALLKGILVFIEKKGVDPAKDMNAFYDFIKKSLHFDVVLSQLKDKVWRLKRKFENHVSKGKKGEDKTFSKPHDQQLFDLSKKIWGREGFCGKSKSLAPLNIESSVGVEEGEKADKMEVEVADKMEIEVENHVGTKVTAKFDRGVGVASMEDYVIKRGLDMVDGPKKSEMEEKWRKMHVAELELFLKRNQLISEQAKLMLAAYKSV